MVPYKSKFVVIYWKLFLSCLVSEDKTKKNNPPTETNKFFDYDRE